MTLRVLSCQYSGVAWVPARIARLMEPEPTIEMRCIHHGPKSESYGLNASAMPVEHIGRGHAWKEAEAWGADILHLHHDRIAGQALDGCPPEIRKRFKVICTVHGEPDRSRGKVDSPVDLYHVVQPDLLALANPRGIPMTWIPNHPARNLVDRPTAEWLDRPKTLLVPFSHVARFKNHQMARHVSRLLNGRGWTTTLLEKPVTNDEMVERLSEVRACWVQLAGYYDILTMECWSLGCVPIVGAPTYAWNGPPLQDGPPIPQFPFRVNDTAETFVEALDHPTGLESSVRMGGHYMATTWNEAAAADRWTSLYHEL